ncbi:hypothetical protein T439DRAFT_325167 [Meredithblackwellia eburnea MCA 4105]
MEGSNRKQPNLGTPPATVLFQLNKENPPTEAQIAEYAAAARAMVGKIPGLVSLDVGPCLPGTLFRSQGFDFCLFGVLEKAEDLLVYAPHEAHQEVVRLCAPLRNPDPATFLAFDFESGIKF